MKISAPAPAKNPGSSNHAFATNLSYIYLCGSGSTKVQNTAVLWIRIRLELLTGSGSGIKVLDPDPQKSERACK